MASSIVPDAVGNRLTALARAEWVSRRSDIGGATSSQLLSASIV
jgi:hypothetical protein